MRKNGRSAVQDLLRHRSRWEFILTNIRKVKEAASLAAAVAETAAVTAAVVETATAKTARVKSASLENLPRIFAGSVTTVIKLDIGSVIVRIIIKDRTAAETTTLLRWP